MSVLSEGFRAAIKQLLENKNFRVDEVLKWEEVSGDNGYCDSCWDPYTHVFITYRDGDAEKEYEYYGTFGELMEELLAE